MPTWGAYGSGGMGDGFRRRIVYSDDFNRADSTNIGPNWTEDFGTGIQISGKKIIGGGSAGTAHWSTPMGSNDMWAQCNMVSAGNASLYVRADAAVAVNQYHVFMDNAGNIVRLRRNGSIIANSAGQSNTTGTLRVEIVANTITVMWEGTTVICFTDSSPLVNGQYTGIRADSGGDIIANFMCGPL